MNRRVEAELLDPSGERLDAARALRPVALPDVRRQEDPEPADLGHERSTSGSTGCGLIGRDTPGRASRRTTRAPSSMSSVAKIRSEASSSAARPASRSVVGRQVDQALGLAHGERAARGDLLADGPSRARRPRRPARPRGRGRSARPRRRSGPGRSGSAPWPGPSPTTRGSRCVPPAPGVTARRTSGRPSLARSEAIRRSQHSASSSPPPSALPSIAAIVGIGSSARRRATPASSSWRSRPPGPALRLELADVRAGRERPLAAPGHDDRPDVAGRRRLERRQRRVAAPRAARA